MAHADSNPPLFGSGNSGIIASTSSDDNTSSRRPSGGVEESNNDRSATRVAFACDSQLGRSTVDEDRHDDGSIGPDDIIFCDTDERGGADGEFGMMGVSLTGGLDTMDSSFSHLPGIGTMDMESLQGLPPFEPEYEEDEGVSFPLSLQDGVVRVIRNTDDGVDPLLASPRDHGEVGDASQSHSSRGELRPSNSEDHKNKVGTATVSLSDEISLGSREDTAAEKKRGATGPKAFHRRERLRLHRDGRVHGVESDNEDWSSSLVSSVSEFSVSSASVSSSTRKVKKKNQSDRKLHGSDWTLESSGDDVSCVQGINKSLHWSLGDLGLEERKVESTKTLSGHSQDLGKLNQSGQLSMPGGLFRLAYFTRKESVDQESDGESSIASYAKCADAASGESWMGGSYSSTTTTASASEDESSGRIVSKDDTDRKMRGPANSSTSPSQQGPSSSERSKSKRRKRDGKKTKLDKIHELKDTNRQLKRQNRDLENQLRERVKWEADLADVTLPSKLGLVPTDGQSVMSGLTEALSVTNGAHPPPAEGDTDTRISTISHVSAIKALSFAALKQKKIMDVQKEQNVRTKNKLEKIRKKLKAFKHREKEAPLQGGVSVGDANGEERQATSSHASSRRRGGIRLRKELDTHKVEVMSLQAELDKALQAKEEAEKQRDSDRKKMAMLDSRLLSAEGQMSQMWDERVSNERRIETLEAELDQRDGVVEKLERRNLTLEEKVSTLEREKDRLAAQVAAAVDAEKVKNQSQTVKHEEENGPTNDQSRIRKTASTAQSTCFQPAATTNDSGSVSDVVVAVPPKRVLWQDPDVPNTTRRTQSADPRPGEATAELGSSESSGLSDARSSPTRSSAQEAHIARIVQQKKQQMSQRSGSRWARRFKSGSTGSTSSRMDLSADKIISQKADGSTNDADSHTPIRERNVRISELERTVESNERTIAQLRSDVVRANACYKEDTYVNKMKIQQLLQENTAYAIKVKVLEKEFQKMNIGDVKASGLESQEGTPTSSADAAAGEGSSPV